MDDQHHNFKLLIAYDGTAYNGWQIQPNGTTIQEIIQNQLAIILKESVAIIGSGRTDSGVHALGQVAHFKYREAIDAYRLLGSLNGLLPQDIRIKEITSVPSHFHAQHSAIAKTYHYHLHLDKIMNPFNRLYRFHLREKISLDKLKTAAARFIGTHDFTSFANEAHKGVAAYDSVRTIKRLDIVEQDGGVRLEFEADGFLYKMVRNIVGTLLEVAGGKREEGEIPKIIAAKARPQAGKAAPPQGLFLVKVHYPELHG